MVGDTYTLRIFYTVAKTDDMDIVDEGVDDERTSPELRELLGHLADFVHRVGEEFWDECDDEMQTCWLPMTQYAWHAADGEGLDISFSARITRERTRDVHITKRRLRAAL